MAVLNKLKGIDLTPSNEWLARYLHDCSADWKLTAYKSISKLPPASILGIKGAHVSLHAYFDFSDVTDIVLNTDRDYVEKYRELLHRVTRDRLRSDYAVGTELSGGLDSSTITQLAAQHMQDSGRNLHAFGMVNFEMDAECIMSVSTNTRLFMTHLLTSQSESDIDFARKIFFDTNGVPEEHGDATGYIPFYEVAGRVGARTLLSGLGGDEFVTNAGGVALAQLYNERRYRMFLSRHRGNWLKYLRALKWILLQHFYHHKFPIDVALASRAKRTWSRRLVNDQIAHEIGLKSNILTDNYYTAGYVSLNEFVLNNRHSPRLTARLENATLVAAAYGIDYRWPLLDVRLISYFLAIPVEQKFGPAGVSRYLHRRAVDGLLPDFITWKDKSMGGILRKDSESAVSPLKPFDPHPFLSAILHSQHVDDLVQRLTDSSKHEEDYLDSWSIELMNSANEWLNKIDNI
jgi:asparagine synthase (glutamine-hydrolysing)